MWFVDIALSELPAYVGIASHGHVVIAHAHYNFYPDALAWCARAMKRSEGASQIAIARPTVMEWPEFGKVPALLPLDGWLLEHDGWSRAEPMQLVRNFHHVPDSPTTLLTEPPSDGSDQRAAPNAPVRSPVMRTVSASTNPVVLELQRLNNNIERLLRPARPDPTFHEPSPVAVPRVEYAARESELRVGNPWEDHAYPLQQIIIRLQGTRHSDRAAIIDQLGPVAERLRAGDLTGEESDDDFGYSFEVDAASAGPSFFAQGCSRR